MYGLFGHVGISPTADDIDRLSLKISAQTISVAQNYSQHSQSEDEFNWLYHAYLNRKIKKNISQRKRKTKRNMETFVKIGFAKISLAAPKPGLPKIWEGGGRVGSPQLPRPVRLWVL